MILITRHKTENKKLSILLKNKKIKVVDESFVYFKNLNKLIKYKENKVFIVASTQAVKTIALKKNLSKINKSTFLAVGEKTTKQLKKLGLKVIVSSPTSSKLAKEIKKNKLFKERSFEYLCSNIYNKEFLQDLKQNGFKISLNKVYRTEAKKLMTNHLVKKLNDNQIHMILFFSLFAMKIFFTLCRKYKISKMTISQIQYLCLSKRIASYAINQQLKAKWPKYPNQDAMVKLLHQCV